MSDDAPGDPANDDDTDGNVGELCLAVQVAAGKLQKIDQPAAFFDWARIALPLLMPQMFSRLTEPDRALKQRSLSFVLARNLWLKIPDAAHQFQARTLPKLERNAPCPCESGLKYKHCCEPMMDMAGAFENISLLPCVLETLPLTQLRKLPFNHLRPEEVAHTAETWIEDGEDKRAVALLEAQLGDLSHADGRHSQSYWLLVDTYDRLGRPGKKMKLIEAGLAAPHRQIRSDAAQRLATIYCDRGDMALAWEMFTTAQRATPDDPSLSHLEILLLGADGRAAEAVERAQFWHARLKRRSDVNPRLLEFLANAARDPSSALFEVSAHQLPSLDRLQAMLAKLPAVECLYSLDAGDLVSTGPLVPMPALRKPLAQWHAAATQPKPDLTWMEAESSMIDWDDAGTILALLERQPQLWSSFEVLDDLVLSLSADGLALPGVQERILQPLRTRAVALLEVVLDRHGARDKRLEWGWMENRPALRLVVSHLFDLQSMGSHAEALRLMEWMVFTLNPNDNHGLRDTLLSLYLRAGRIDDAWRLHRQYPDDGGALFATQPLTLFMLGRRKEAEAALAEVRRDAREMLAMLLADKPKKPKLTPGLIAMGGKDEAWYYRARFLDIWQSSGALDWARSLQKRGSKAAV